MGWISLPTEIKTQILEDLLLSENTAVYASVCRDWQAIIEPKNFLRLKVTQSRLRDFSNIGYRHRHLVGYIWLSIDPVEFHCPQCGDLVPGKKEASIITIKRAIQDLVIHLSRWDPRGSNLVLDISVKPSSSLLHPFGVFRYGSNVTSELRRAQGIQCLDDSHLPQNRDQRIAELEGKLEGKPRPREEMPKAKAVTSLLLRRQTRRLWKLEELEELLDLLPGVREIHCEPWRHWGHWGRMGELAFHCELLKFNQLRRVVIFENFQSLIYSEACTLALQDQRSRASRALVEASTGLEHLAISFLIDASQFFKACQQSSIWPWLESLALTSHVLGPQHQSDRINDLLETSAIVASNMPRLKTMELWNGGPEYAGLFQYKIHATYKTGRTAKITWRSTWDLSLEPHVRKAWQSVASEQACGQLQVVNEMLDADVALESQSDAIRYLQPLNTVIHSASLWQSQEEATRSGRSRHSRTRRRFGRHAQSRHRQLT